MPTRSTSTDIRALTVVIWFASLILAGAVLLATGLAIGLDSTGAGHRTAGCIAGVLGAGMLLLGLVGSFKAFARATL